MRKNFLAALLLPLAGCFSAPVRRAGYLGMTLCPAQAGIEVPQVFPGSPAQRAGIQNGDLLTSYRGLDLAQPANRKTLLWDIRNGVGAPMALTIKRGEKSAPLKVTPKQRNLHPKDELLAALTEELLSGRRVSVAVVVSQINHTRPELFKNAQALDAWKEGTKASLRGQFEELLLGKGLSRCGGYGVVDRDKTSQVLEELHFQMTGAVSPETAKELGKMTGASHLLFVSFTRYPQSSGDYQDDVSARLVSVESGAVAAAARFKAVSPSN